MNGFDGFECSYRAPGCRALPYYRVGGVSLQLESVTVTRYVIRCDCLFEGYGSREH
jgi:hypothetical protein